MRFAVAFSLYEDLCAKLGAWEKAAVDLLGHLNAESASER